MIFYTFCWTWARGKLIRKSLMITLLQRAFLYYNPKDGVPLQCAVMHRFMAKAQSQGRSHVCSVVLGRPLRGGLLPGHPSQPSAQLNPPLFFLLCIDPLGNGAFNIRLSKLM